MKSACRQVVVPTIALAMFVISTTTLSADDGPEVDFTRDIRPILASTCFTCHGPDGNKREGELRLDTPEGALADLGGYKAIEPGDPEASTAVDRMLSDDPDERMPPPDSQLTLTPKQIALLTRWIKQGAHYEKHWAFNPLTRPAVPAVKGKGWGRNPIDTFVQKRLEDAGLAPSAEADRQTLIRRLSLDLTGLAPTLDEVDAFVSDESPNAYERLVDRILASPHYGERWGRHWLDQARYADTNGYTVDSERSIWPYRDWVIEAVNDDMPFDQFTIEQLAGDLLPSPTQSQLVATGFHRNTLVNQEGGTDKEQFRNEAVVDRVVTTGAVWLGLTASCGQCHSHKYDPFSQEEFYQIFAFFNSSQDVNSVSPTLSLPSEEQTQKLKEFDAQIKAAKETLAAHERKKKEAADKNGKDDGKPIVWKVVDVLSTQSANGATFETLDDQSILVGGVNAANEEYVVTIPPALKTITGVRLETLTHASLPGKGPGRASNGNFVLSEVELTRAASTPLTWKHATADHSQKDHPIGNAVDGDAGTGWAINVSKGSLHVNRTAEFVLNEPLTLPGDEPLTFTLKFSSKSAQYNIGRFRLALTDAPEAKFKLPDAEHDRLAAALKKVTDSKSAFNRKIPTTMVMRDLAKPRETHVLIRGDFLRKGKPVQPGVPAAFTTGDPKAGYRTRLDLARWLVSRDNPLTARVTVNRAWMRYFGKGIVGTENDFGIQGALPTHPQLLDWLAVEFMDRGWSMKQLHRLIVTSATYRQSSQARDDLNKADPRNYLLGRQVRVRVDAEIIRDLALSVSGLISEQIGGPSVYPPQPEGVYAFTQRAAKWPTSTGSQRYRRGMYTFFMRSAPYPMMTTFDAPRFNATCTSRNRSNTPLQSLTMANDETMIEIAQAFARRILKQPAGDDRSRLRYAFQVALTRHPQPAELDRLAEFLSAQRDDFAAAPEDAQSVAGKPLDDSASPVELATWTTLARVLLNLDEFITRE